MLAQSVQPMLAAASGNLVAPSLNVISRCRHPVSRTGARTQQSRQSSIPSRGAAQVCAAKKKKMYVSQPRGQPVVQRPPTPPINKENVEFVLFARDSRADASDSSGRWTPLSVVVASGPANQLVSSLDSKWGQALFSNALIRSIAAALYKDQKKIEKQLRRNVPYLADTEKFSYGFKIRDKKDAKAWSQPVNITTIPAPGVVSGNPLDNARKFFGSAFQ